MDPQQDKIQVGTFEVYMGSGELVARGKGYGTGCRDKFYYDGLWYYYDQGRIATTTDESKLTQLYMYDVLPFNYRYHRFEDHSYPFVQERGNAGFSFPIASGTLPKTNRQVVLTQDNKLEIQLYDANHPSGFFVDDLGALYGRWLKTLKDDQFRRDAFVCNRMGLLALDNRAIGTTNNYDKSKVERCAPPDKEKLMPTLEEWVDIWKRIKGQ